ncbi:MAG: response regulator [Chloroherpetonaceae bacterium]|nr:response regulator [Chloroherpetonaceae bacterium]
MVVIVDKEPHFVQSLTEYLSKEFPVIGFTCAEAALQYIEKNFHRIALCITDNQMPQLNGIEFAKKVKSQDREIEVLLTCRFYDYNDFERLLKEQVINEFLQKPFSFETIYSKLQTRRKLVYKSKRF